MFSNTEYWQKKLTKIEPKLVKILRIKDHEFNVERKALESFHRKIKEMENKEEVNEAGEGDSKNRKQDDKKKRKRDCLLFDDDISADLRLIFGTDDDLECKKKMKERKDDKRRSVIKNESEKIRVKGENENFDGSIKDKRKGVGNSDKSTGKEDNAADASNFTNDKAEPAGKGGYGRGKGKGKKKTHNHPPAKKKQLKTTNLPIRTILLSARKIRKKQKHRRIFKKA
ncbi:hypothetical protein EDEG_02981 [Edhazardia aedis USNM 41457]|uniref:Uncharacterized protein n=1 Tax=Edhazardia aedis (strain USNM 41457) TaxID=1003232 RepID=J8ZSK0_EDHAE|nr:hypothetical protein EDEG_02981 [Edhazardia aedis USNM 41457]|eukprot:EJW02623.1 hypothetical protein EDEG_02981 [Edhazardia aedis USNM 41457]